MPGHTLIATINLTAMKIFKTTSLLLLAGVLSATAASSAGNHGKALSKAPTNRFVRPHTQQKDGIVPASMLKMRSSSNREEASRVTAGGTNLYGYLNFWGTPGLYQFNKTGFSKVWTDPMYEDMGGFDAVYYNHGKICAFYPYVEYYGGEFFFEGVTYYELDFNTGNITKEYYIEDFWMDYGYFINLAYDADNDEVYGYATYDEEGETACFMKTKGTNPQFSDYVKIKDYGNSSTGFFKQCYSMCWNQIDGLLYGINLNNQLVTIDKSTGEQTEIMKIPSTVPVPSPGNQYISGFAYSPTEDVFYWELQYDDRSGNPVADLYTIDINTKTCSKVENFPEAEGFCAFWVIGDNTKADAPKRPEFVSADFSGGSLSGSLVYTMPNKCLNGTTIAGDVTWNLTINGKNTSTGSAAPGSSVTIPATVSSAGNYTFELTASYQGVQSAPVAYTAYIGADKPKAPTNVTLNPTTYFLYWTKVTEGVTGGYIDTSNIEYEVYLNGQLQGTTKTNTYQLTLPSDLKWGEVAASVVAVVNGSSSAPGYSNIIMAGAPWDLPVDLLCNEDNLRYVTIKNLDGDEWTWEMGFWDDYWYSYQVEDNAKMPGDDWIILPPINFSDPDAYYSFTIDARKHAGNLYPDTWMEVKYGPIPDPALMDEVILAPWEPQIRDFFSYTNPMFQVAAPGTWYIGIRCVTAIGQLGCDVSRIKVEQVNYDLQGPGECTDVTLASTTQTSLDANVTFTFPTKTLGGEIIPSSTEITAVITCGDNKVSVSGKPGQTTTANIATYQGPNDIFLQCYIGDLKGASSQYSLFTGEVVPGYVFNLQGQMQPDMMSVTLTWTPPTPWVSGVWEGGVNPETTWYNVWLHGSNGKTYSYTTPKGVTEYTATLPEGAPQDIYQICIQSENVAGNNGNYMDLSAVMGTPYQLPMVGGFSNGKFDCSPWLDYSPTNSSAVWSLMRLSSIASDWAGRNSYALVGYSLENTSQEGILGLPRFSTKGEDVVNINITYYAGIEAADLTVKASTYEIENPQSLFSWTVTGKDNPDEFRTVSGQLPASLLDKDWVQVYLDAFFGANAHYAIITDIEIENGDSGVLMSMNGQGSVAALKGAIEIKGYEGQSFMIADLSGIVHAQGTLSGDATRVELAAGIYAVKVDGKSYKVNVK